MVIARKRPGKRLTFEELLALPEEKPALEYFDGVVTQKVSPERDHSSLQYEICAWVNQAALLDLGAVIPGLTLVVGESFKVFDFE